MTASYRRVLELARGGDLDAARALLRELRRRGESEGLAVVAKATAYGIHDLATFVETLETLHDLGATELVEECVPF